MAINHQSPASNLAPFAYKTINTTLWGASSNALTISDTYINSNSVVLAYVTGSVPAAGRWSYAITDNQCIITSTDGESSTLPVSYIVL